MSFREPLLLTILIASACSQSRPRQPSHLVTDSAGVTIVVSSAPAWGEGEGWRLSDAPEVVIGATEGEEAYLLADVRGARRLPDGRIAVLDAGSTRVRVYDGDGRHLVDIGGPGDGPAEFRTPQFMDLVGDTIVVHEYLPGSLSWFLPEGTFVRRLSVPSPPGAQARRMAVGYLDDGSGIALGLPSRRQYSEGLNRLPLPLWRFGLREARIDSLGQVPGWEENIDFPAPGSTRHAPHIFGNTAYLATSGDEVFVGATDTYSIEVRTPDNTLRRIVRRVVPTRSVVPSDVDRYVQRRIELANAPEEERPAWERNLRATTVADRMPAYRWITVDAEGNLWVEEWDDVGLSQGDFAVFDPSGVWLGRVAVPPGLSPERGGIFQNWVEVGPDYFLGVWVGELGVEQVRQYRIFKP